MGGQNLAPWLCDGPVFGLWISGEAGLEVVDFDDLRDRADRARAYEIVLREGDPEQITALVDGVLLVDLWPELVLPQAVRRAWAALIETTTGASCPG